MCKRTMYKRRGEDKGEMSHDIYCMPTACAHAVSCSALLEHFSVCLQQVCPNQYSADFTLLQVQVKYTLTRHCHSSENQLKLPYYHTFELTITVNEDYLSGL